MLLYNDIQNCYAACVKFDCWNRLNTARQAVLIDMCFNLGIGRLKQFKKMFAALSQGDYDKAAAEMLDSVWAKQVKSRAAQLAEIMRKGEIK